MKYDIKLIGLDLDGTVFDENKNISERTKNSIRKAIQKEVVVLPVTGRPKSGLPEEFLSIPGVRYAVTTNGAMILDLQENKVIYSDLLDVRTVLALVNILIKYDVMVDVSIDGFGYCQKDKLDNALHYIKSISLTEYVKKRRIPVNDIRKFVTETNKPAEKVQAFLSDMSLKEEILKELNAFGEFAITSGALNNIEINKSTVNKGTGLIELGKQLGIQKDQIMACGDGGNDLEMLKQVGLSVAMENGIKEVKEIADYITESNEEDGVAIAIEKFVL